MKDPTGRIRKKARLAAEIRYPVVPQFIDIRGAIIANLREELEGTFDHWTSDPAKIVFLDRDGIPMREFLISPQRTSVILEDGAQVPEFMDRVAKCFRLMYNHLGEWITESTRVGVRFIEVMEPDRLRRYEDVHSRILSKLHRLPENGLNYTDSFSKLVHDFGFYQVGPIKGGEPWLTENFKLPDENVPDVGVGFDIDSYKTDVAIGDAEAMVEAVVAVCELTKSIEEELVSRLGLVDG